MVICLHLTLWQQLLLEGLSSGNRICDLQTPNAYYLTFYGKRKCADL